MKPGADAPEVRFTSPEVEADGQALCRLAGEAGGRAIPAGGCMREAAWEGYPLGPEVTAADTARYALTGKPPDLEVTPVE